MLRRHRYPDAYTDFNLMTRQLERLGDEFRDSRGQIDRSGPLL